MATLKFTSRPAPVLAEHRPLYKIAQCLLIIDTCGRAQKCSLLKLHLINWALKKDSRIEDLKAATQNKQLSIPVWGFDPALAVALQIASEEDILKSDETGIVILPAGQEFLSEIASDPKFLSTEKAQLDKIGKKLTEKMVAKTARDWE
ncbi:hypothetical protein ACIP02_21020 [Pseudomonas sp. NPDC089408]|uniref:hypothetical protein n=1 Tax=Pseudomonas TaxID=286 RepID=UPI0010FC53DA|nr:hypothetical protein [Pseudomonas sp. SGAir0191]QCU71452.1 hypothetical protein CWR53_22930 [Pseudomonas sp. SGAir0191]